MRGRGSWLEGRACACGKIHKTHHLLRGGGEKKKKKAVKALICTSANLYRSHRTEGAGQGPRPSRFPSARGGARGAALAPHWLRAATCRPRPRAGSATCGGAARARASARRGRPHRCDPHRCDPIRSTPQRRPRLMRQRRACGLRLEQAAGCAPPPALPGLSLPSRQGAAGRGRWGLRAVGAAFALGCGQRVSQLRLPCVVPLE